MIVSLEKMKSYLRVDYDTDDEIISHLINSAEERCRAVSRNEDFENDPNAVTAVLYAAAYMYEHRENADMRALNLTLRAMLFDKRKVCF